MERLGKTIITGPCAAETETQLLKCAQLIKERGLSIMRGSLWKPRTRPGFEGVGTKGILWFAEVTKMGITIATEVLLPNHVSEVIKGLSENGDPNQLLLWIGSRNQNHFVQKEIALRVKDETPASVKLMIKNQPWGDETHWLGIIEHATGVRLSPERIILCHRGFSPYGQNNPNNFRNLPDFEMAMRVKEKTGLPMLVDPSHIGGSVENVFKVIELAIPFNFDGLMVEVHPNPEEALTDKNQQLSFKQLDKLLKIFNQ